MRNILLIALGVLALSGCAVKKDMIPLSGSKADGSVRMGYTFSEFENPQVDIQQASALASQKCSAWGYSEAKPFGGQTSKCITAGGMSGCSVTEVSVEFQCIGGKASEN